MAREQKFKVTIDSAKGLLAADFNGKSDPFVQFQWRGEKYKTEVIRKTLAPSWKQTFILQYQMGKDSRFVHLEIWDWDLLTRNDPLGQVTVDLSTVQGVLDKWYPINQLAGVGKGQLRVIIENLEAGAQRPHQSSPPLQPQMSQGPLQAFSAPAAGQHPYPSNPYLQPQTSGVFANPPTQQFSYPNLPFPYPYQQSYPPPNHQFGHANQHPSSSPGYQHMNSFSQNGMPYAPPAPYGIQALPSYGMPQQLLPSYGMPQQPLPSYGMSTQPLPGGPWNGWPQNLSPVGTTTSVVAEIQNILPYETLDNIKSALGRFDGDKEKAVRHLIDSRCNGMRH